MRTVAALRSELSKIFRQRVTWSGFLVMAVLAALVTWGSHHERDRIDVADMLGGEFVVAGNTISALFIANATMQVAAVVLMPLLVAVVVGGLVAGEKQSGTLRTLLCRPVSRTAILLSKLAAAWAYTLALTLTLGAVSLGLGYLVFGWGDLVVLNRGLVIFEPGLGLTRLAMAYGLAAAAMGTVAAVALMLSVIFDNPMTAAGLTVAALLVSGIVSQMPYFASIDPHLLTSHVRLYREVLSAEIDQPDLIKSAQYLAGYSVVAIAVALAVFTRKDVTT